MATLQEEAAAYVPPQTKNIADLDAISVSLNVEEEEYTKKDSNETFKVLIAEIDGEKYRVPKSVIAELKVMLAEKPDMTEFKVAKAGEGMNTKYSVIPL